MSAGLTRAEVIEAITLADAPKRVRVVCTSIACKHPKLRCISCGFLDCAFARERDRCFACLHADRGTRSTRSSP